MTDRPQNFLRPILILGLISLALLIHVYPNFNNGFATAWLGDKEPLLTVAFLDVGQGDAIFIETPEGVQILIDGGPDGTILRELGKYMSVTDRSLDVVLATHPDKDHIGGLVDVIERYEVKTIVHTENQSDTAVSSAFIFVSSSEGAKMITSPRAGDVLSLGTKTTLQIMAPAGDSTNWESNASSIVAKLSYGEIDFMLTGDASVGIEEYLVKQQGENLQSEVLKLGHHGSKTSTAENFLAAVGPTYAVVSAGLNNTYGHPHAEVINRVEERGIQLLSTMGEGAVVFQSDGEQVWVK